MLKAHLDPHYDLASRRPEMAQRSLNWLVEILGLTPGGELLFLALAACYCNDIYREAEKQGIRVASEEVEVSGDFGAPASQGPT